MYSLPIHYCVLTIQSNPAYGRPLRDIHHKYTSPETFLMLTFAIVFLVVGIIGRAGKKDVSGVSAADKRILK